MCISPKIERHFQLVERCLGRVETRSRHRSTYLNRGWAAAIVSKKQLNNILMCKKKKIIIIITTIIKLHDEKIKRSCRRFCNRLGIEFAKKYLTERRGSGYSGI